MTRREAVRVIPAGIIAAVLLWAVTVVLSVQ